jgi:ankyrin repeat protein
MKLLLKAGARIDLQDTAGKTPLHWASLNEHDGTHADFANALIKLYSGAVSLLLSQSANASICDAKGNPSIAWMGGFRSSGQETLTSLYK